jgi:hypothetical protein
MLAQLVEDRLHGQASRVEERSMRLTPALAFILSVFVGCASSKSQDRGLVGTGEDPAGSAPDTNPDNVPYPTDNIGTLPRRGATAGNRIKNYKFLGYPNADASKGLQPLSLAEFYDPTGKNFRIVHIQAAGVWCSACQAETRVIVPMKADLDARKVVWLVSLAEGPTPGTPSKQADLDGWIAEYKSPYTHWLDPDNANLGPFYDRSALPWNANIDARTMEILTAETGTAASRDAILKEFDDAIKMSDDKTVKVAGQ